jgi:hypothetical protein
VIAVRLRQDDYVALRRLAQADDRSVSQFVRRRLRELVAAEGTERDALVGVDR